MVLAIEDSIANPDPRRIQQAEPQFWILIFLGCRLQSLLVDLFGGSCQGFMIFY